MSLQGAPANDGECACACGCPVQAGVSGWHAGQAGAQRSMPHRKRSRQSRHSRLQQPQRTQQHAAVARHRLQVARSSAGTPRSTHSTRCGAHHEREGSCPLSKRGKGSWLRVKTRMRRVALACAARQGTHAEGGWWVVHGGGQQLFRGQAASRSQAEFARDVDGMPTTQGFQNTTLPAWGRRKKDPASSTHVFLTGHQ